MKMLLIGKGYKWLGAGVDQDVFLEKSTGMVLKVFPAARVRNTSANIAFINYCLDNPDNEFLPTFTGWTRFEYNSRQYLQIRTERLFPLKDHELEYGLEWMAETANAYSINSLKTPKLQNSGPKIIRDSNLLSMTLDEEGVHKLWKTLIALRLLGLKLGVNRLDLHGGNFMHGSDGQIVINDPFHVSRWDPNP
tara:strand:+ start:4251 stop:4829 length:579 start_codon:yes stop_codon:yes gene_type:complete